MYNCIIRKKQHAKILPKENTMKKYYATYQGSDVILVFDSRKERDDYVWFDLSLYPECIKVSEKRIHDRIKGKEPAYDPGFGCMVIVS